MRKSKHTFLQQRNLQSGFIVVSLNDYSTHPNGRGGFMPGPGTMIKGYLWPTQQAAEEAAKHVLQQHPEKVFGVLELVAIVETSAPPTKVTRL